LAEDEAPGSVREENVDRVGCGIRDRGVGEPVGVEVREREPVGAGGRDRLRDAERAGAIRKERRYREAGVEGDEVHRGVAVEIGGEDLEREERERREETRAELTETVAEKDREAGGAARARTREDDVEVSVAVDVALRARRAFGREVDSREDQRGGESTERAAAEQRDVGAALGE
jgi:hypothetical protein